MSPMKIGLPRGWFARIVLGGWALLFAGTFLVLLVASLSPGRLAGQLINAVAILSVLVVLGTVVYAAAYTVGRLFYYWRTWRRKGSELGDDRPIRPIERILVAGWIVFIAAALGGLIFQRAKWVQAFGAGVLFSLFCVVGLSSSAYGSYLLLRQVMKHLGRS